MSCRRIAVLSFVLMIELIDLSVEFFWFLGRWSCERRVAQASPSLQVQVPGTSTLAATCLQPGAPCTYSQQQRHPAISLLLLQPRPLQLIQANPLPPINSSFSLFVSDSRELLLSTQWLLLKSTTSSTTPLPTTPSRPTTQLLLLPATQPSSCTARLEMRLS